MGMIRKLLGNYLRKRALERGTGVNLWRKVAHPSTSDWTAYLKKHGKFHSFGEHCFISPESVFTDPEFTSIGNNVRIAGAWMSAHDGSINMLNRAYGRNLDTVGPVIIKDDVFIGRGATILPGVTIGPRAIVGAGAVIGKDVAPNTVVAGNPARVIRTLDEHVERIQKRTDGYPWHDIIEARPTEYDPAIEARLKRLRIEHFFGTKTDLDP